MCSNTGVTVQLFLYIFNGTLWFAGFAGIFFGFFAASGSNTISLLDINYLDYLITTPATIFMFYGIALLITTTVGCYAAVSSRVWIIILYCILIIGFIGFDVILGIAFSYKLNAYRDFLVKMQESQRGYTDEGDLFQYGYFGVVPVHPRIFWDHFQRRGQCCGLHTFEEWNNSIIASEQMEFSIPDSCCNVDYEYPQCGQLFWRHPDHGTHTKEKLINDKGCLSIFPDILQLEDNKIVEVAGKLSILFLVICFVLAFILFSLVAASHFKPDEGLANPDFLDIERRKRRIHPGDGDARKISFDLGPRYIPHPGTPP